MKNHFSAICLHFFMYVSQILKILFFSFPIFQKGAAMCPHSLIKNQLEQHLNQNRNLALLGKILHETYGAIKALARLPSTPVTIPKINPPVQTFAFIAQSPTHYKVIFYR